MTQAQAKFYTEIAKKTMAIQLDLEKLTLWQFIVYAVTNNVPENDLYNFFLEKRQSVSSPVFSVEIDKLFLIQDDLSSWSFVVIAGFEWLHNNRGIETHSFSISLELKKRNLSNSDFLKWAETKGVIFSDKEVSTHKTSENLTKSAVLAWKWFFSEC